jgi:hypothetical protein
VERRVLTRAQTAEFDRFGFVRLSGVFPESDAARMRAHVTRTRRAPTAAQPAVGHGVARNANVVSFIDSAN